MGGRGVFDGYINPPIFKPIGDELDKVVREDGDSLHSFSSLVSICSSMV